MNKNISVYIDSVSTTPFSNESFFFCALSAIPNII